MPFQQDVNKVRKDEALMANLETARLQKRSASVMHAKSPLEKAAPRGRVQLPMPRLLKKCARKSCFAIFARRTGILSRGAPR